MKRYPLGPLQALTRNNDGMHMSTAEIGACVGVSGDAVRKWTINGLTERRADEVAVALGFDPYNVWPEMLDDAIAGVGAGMCGECGELFYKAQTKQEFCQRTCKERHYDRHRRVRKVA